MFGFGEWEVLDEGGFDLGVAEFGEFFRVVDGGEDWGVGEHLVKCEVDAFGAALVGHPVEDEGDFDMAKALKSAIYFVNFVALYLIAFQGFV